MNFSIKFMVNPGRVLYELGFGLDMHAIFTIPFGLGLTNPNPAQK